VIDARTGAVAVRVAGRAADQLTPESFTADGTRLVLSGPSPRVVETATGRDVLALRSGEAEGAWISADGSAALVLAAGEVDLYDGRTGARRWSPGLPWEGQYGAGVRRTHVQIKQAALSADGESVLVQGWATHWTYEPGRARYRDERDEYVSHSAVFCLLYVRRDRPDIYLDSEDDPCPGDLASASFGPASPHVLTVSACRTDVGLHRADDLESWRVLNHALPVVGAWVAAGGERVVTLDEGGTARLWLVRFDGYDPLPLEQLAGAVMDPPNAFGLPLPPGGPAPQYRVFSLGSLGTMLEAWPSRQAAARLPEESFVRLAVQPGSGGRVFAGVDDEGAVKLFAAVE
jgi:hypothetical protein